MDEMERMNREAHAQPGGYPRPGKQPCPYCQTPMECDDVDVGIGCVQCGPYFCENCGASEIFWKDRQDPKLSEEERKTGFYKPGSPVSPRANTLNGVLVSVDVARLLYRAGVELDDRRDEIYVSPQERIEQQITLAQTEPNEKDRRILFAEDTPELSGVSPEPGVGIDDLGGLTGS